jgi:tetratricopeptide (TPR) repeat protein
VALVAGAATLLAVALGASHARLGFSLDAGDLGRALGGERTTEHFVLFYSPSGPFAKEIDRVAADHELRYAELRELFGVAPSGKVHAYLFDSAAQKQALMGAARTSVAKPWRREIYLQYEPWPHPVLMHELAHVFAGAFGDPLLHVSRQGAHLNLGLVEGVAVAASVGGGGLTPHQLVKAMRRFRLEPPLDEVMSLRFLGWSGSQAYAVAGSFCRFLVETRGAAPLERVYQAGGSDESYRAAYGAPRAALEAEWSRFIDGVQLDEHDLGLAEDRLRRPSVFHKTCAHELALRREAARKASTDGDRARALLLLESVCRDEPDDPENLAEVMQAARAAGDAERAARVAAALGKHPKATASLRARAEALTGDLALERGDWAAAEAAYRAAEALPEDEPLARLTTVKRLTAKERPPPPDLVHFLVETGTHDPAADLVALRGLVDGAPERGLYHYLYARQLEARGRDADAAAELERALALGLPDARFAREAVRMAGVCRLRQGRLDDARALFGRLLDDAATPAGLRLEAADWLRRCDFLTSAPPGGTPRRPP